MSWRLLFDALAPAAGKGRLSVLIFHRVRQQTDPLFPGEIDADRFEMQMRWVSRWFNVLALPDAVERLRSGTLPARAAAMSFDDGYADNCTVALPILRRLGLSCTFFVATGFLDGGRMWNDTVIEAVRGASGTTLNLDALGLDRHDIGSVAARRRTIDTLLERLKYLDTLERESMAADIAKLSRTEMPNDLMLSSGQVRTLCNAGMTIGAHTVNHPILCSISDEAARKEMLASKSRLEEIIGKPVGLFAYPNGKPGKDYSRTHVSIAREAGFSAAFSTSAGVATRHSDLFQLPRFTPWDRSAWRYAMRMAANLRSTEPVIA